MVTLKKFLKMIKSDEAETEKIIDAMTEQDAKAFLKATIKAIKENWSFVSHLEIDTEKQN